MNDCNNISVREIIDGLRKDREEYVDNYIEMMRGFYGASDGEIVELSELTIEICNIVLERVKNSQSGESD